MARTDKSLVANRSMSASVFYREIAAPPNFVTVWQISLGINCVCLLLSLYICREAFIARQRKRNQKAFTQHILRFFVGQAVITALYRFFVILQLLISFHWLACSYVGSLPPIFYGCVKLCSNTLVYLRAKSVLKNQSSLGLKIMKHASIMFIIMFMFVPYTFFIIAGKTFFKEMYCVTTVDVSHWLMFFFSIGDANLSILLLILFIIPLRVINSEQVSRQSERFRRLAWRNLGLSSIELASTSMFLFPSGFSVDQPETLDSSYWALYGAWAGGLETTINLIINYLLFHQLFSHSRLIFPSKSIKTSAYIKNDMLNSSLEDNNLHNHKDDTE